MRLCSRGLSNFSDLTTHQDCSGDLDLSSFACMLRTPSLVISVVRIRDVGRFVLCQIVQYSMCSRTVRPRAVKDSRQRLEKRHHATDQTEKAQTDSADRPILDRKLLSIDFTTAA